MTKTMWARLWVHFGSYRTSIEAKISRALDAILAAGMGVVLRSAPGTQAAIINADEKSQVRAVMGFCRPDAIYSFSVVSLPCANARTSMHTSMHTYAQ
jgi:hypothetical protein